MLAVVLLLETCAGNDLQAERKMAADFGMNIKKVYASQQLPNDKKQSLKKAENTEESVQPAQTVTTSATEPATTEPSETEPALPNRHNRTISDRAFRNRTCNNGTGCNRTGENSDTTGNPDTGSFRGGSYRFSGPDTDRDGRS